MAERLAISWITSSSLALPPPRSGEMDSRWVGKGGSSSSIHCCVLEGASACGCDAVALVLACLSWPAVVCVLNAFCVSSTFALGFLVRTLGGAAGGVDGVRIGVEVAIGGRHDVRKAARAAVQRELVKRDART
ncbi:hypothetical protein CC80DRAFT_506347 [Byssothecium circinans]|uniref:Uncharacterized protein n=1 Tax=Byssothecium circinans TaxID=147558 RepID=A0A6A5TRM0_9PLEO|nr:hypothetical protein CC80DRAFT_506347 [Byssothecium circinans]